MLPGPDPTPARATASTGGTRSSRLRLWALIGGGVVISLTALLVLVLVIDHGNKPAGSGEVFLESAGSAGQDPFTASVARPQPVAPPAPQPPAAAPAALRTISGGEPGLYGGSRNRGTCDTGLLVSFLAQNPDKAAAWASVLGISTPQIRDYVSQLTQVVLRADTRVTNHGFANGKAYPRQSVLQAGTAVLVDRFGAPRVRCEGGNPLLEPAPVTSTQVSYIGDRWPGFSPQSLVVIAKFTTRIAIFILRDDGCGCYFGRPAGGDGSNDTDTQPPPPLCPTGFRYSAQDGGCVGSTPEPCSYAGSNCGETPLPGPGPMCIAIYPPPTSGPCSSQPPPVPQPPECDPALKQCTPPGGCAVAGACPTPPPGPQPPGCDPALKQCTAPGGCAVAGACPTPPPAPPVVGSCGQNCGHAQAWVTTQQQAPPRPPPSVRPEGLRPRLSGRPGDPNASAGPGPVSATG